jgi:endonuclease/exonuclease/phosphatase family metal-dependent hydrolase
MACATRPYFAQQQFPWLVVVSWNIHFGQVDNAGLCAILQLCRQQQAAIVGLQEVCTSTYQHLVQVSAKFGYRHRGFDGPLFGSQGVYRNVILFNASFELEQSHLVRSRGQVVPTSDEARSPLVQSNTDPTYPDADITGWWSSDRIPLKVSTFHVPCSKREVRREETQHLIRPRPRSHVHVVVGDANWQCASRSEHDEVQAKLRQNRGHLLLPTQSTTLHALAGQTKHPADLALLWSSSQWRCTNWQTEILWLKQLNIARKGFKQTFGCTDHQPVCFRVQLLPVHSQQTTK